MIDIHKMSEKNIRKRILYTTEKAKFIDEFLMKIETRLTTSIRIEAQQSN